MMRKARILSVKGLIDGTGGAVRRDVVLEIKEGCIDRIRRAEAEPAPRKKAVEDFSDYTLLPVLADTHVHLCMSGGLDEGTRRHQLRQCYEEAKPVIERHLGEHLACGILAVRDAGDYGGYAHRYRREFLNRHGLPVLLRCAGKAWHASDRYGRLVGCAPLDACTLAQSIRMRGGKSDVIKIVNSGINSLTVFGKETPVQFRVGELKAAVKQAEELGLKTMVHANGYKAVKEAVEAG